eukprot:13327450-Alexandrium_andersonii.AAC.1
MSDLRVRARCAALLCQQLVVAPAESEESRRAPERCEESPEETQRSLLGGAAGSPTFGRASPR